MGLFQKKTVNPDHNDLAALNKLGMRKSMSVEKIRAKEKILDINNRLISGEISYLDAEFECELEDIQVPQSFKRRETLRILSLERTDEFTCVHVAQMLYALSLTVPKTLMLEVQKEMGCTGEEINDIVTNLGQMMADGRKRLRDAEKREKKSGGDESDSGIAD